MAHNPRRYGPLQCPCGQLRLLWEEVFDCEFDLTTLVGWAARNGGHDFGASNITVADFESIFTTSFEGDLSELTFVIDETLACGPALFRGPVDEEAQKQFDEDYINIPLPELLAKTAEFNAAVKAIVGPPRYLGESIDEADKQEIMGQAFCLAIARGLILLGDTHYSEIDHDDKIDGIRRRFRDALLLHPKTYLLFCDCFYDPKDGAPWWWDLDDYRYEEKMSVE